MINGVPRILIVRLSAIGDVVRVLPALHSLRDGFPDAQIDWAVESKAADIIEGHPSLDTVLVFDRPQGVSSANQSFRRFCKDIRDRHYDIVIDFHGTFKSGLITQASKAPDRYGFSRPRAREGSYLFTNRKTSLGKEVLNRIEENLRLSESLTPRRPSLEVFFHVPPDVQAEVEDYFEDTFGGGKLVVAMHVPVDREEKQWPTEHFAALSDQLLADGRFDVVLTWGPGQYPLVQEVVSKCKRNPHSAPEMADLKHYMWLIHNADLFFGGDTGPMHIASAVETPVVAVFGGTNPIQHAPLREPHEILTAESLTSDPAALRNKTGSEKLRLISPEAAYDACVRIATGSSARFP